MQIRIPLQLIMFSLLDTYASNFVVTAMATFLQPPTDVVVHITQLNAPFVHNHKRLTSSPTQNFTMANQRPLLTAPPPSICCPLHQHRPAFTLPQPYPQLTTSARKGFLPQFLHTSYVLSLSPHYPQTLRHHYLASPFNKRTHHNHAPNSLHPNTIFAEIYPIASKFRD